jgi:hypothetical protein
VRRLQARTSAARRCGHLLCDSLHCAAWIGADIIATDARRRVALHQAALAGHSACIVELFRDVTDVNAQDRDGLTPLMLAAGQGHNSAVQSLLRHGKIDVAVENTSGQTARMIAEVAEKHEVVRLLDEFVEAQGGECSDGGGAGLSRSPSDLQLGGSAADVVV